MPLIIDSTWFFRVSECVSLYLWSGIHSTAGRGEALASLQPHGAAGPRVRPWARAPHRDSHTWHHTQGYHHSTPHDIILMTSYWRCFYQHPHSALTLQRVFRRCWYVSKLFFINLPNSKIKPNLNSWVPGGPRQLLSVAPQGLITGPYCAPDLIGRREHVLEFRKLMYGFVPHRRVTSSTSPEEPSIKQKPQQE